MPVLPHPAQKNARHILDRQAQGLLPHSETALHSVHSGSDALQVSNTLTEDCSGALFPCQRYCVFREYRAAAGVPERQAHTALHLPVLFPPVSCVFAYKWKAPPDTVWSPPHIEFPVPGRFPGTGYACYPDNLI